MAMVKIAQKKMSKLFSCDHGGFVNVNFEEIDTEQTLTGKKMMVFDYCEKYLASISNKMILWQS